jgi:hypothetical protein
MLEDAVRILGGQRRDRERDCGAVDDGGGFLRAHRVVRRETGPRRRLRRLVDAALVLDERVRKTANGASDVGERRQVAGGADGSLLGDDGVKPGIEEPEEAVHQRERRAGIGGREGVRAQQHRRPYRVGRKGLTHARRMRPDDLVLVVGHVGYRDPHVLEQADAGVERIHQRRVIVQPVLLDVVAGGADPRARGLVEACLFVAPASARSRDAQHLLASHPPAVDRHRHGWILVSSRSYNGPRAVHNAQWTGSAGHFGPRRGQGPPRLPVGTSAAR